MAAFPPSLPPLAMFASVVALQVTRKTIAHCPTDPWTCAAAHTRTHIRVYMHIPQHAAEHFVWREVM